MVKGDSKRKATDRGRIEDGTSEWRRHGEKEARIAQEKHGASTGGNIKQTFPDLKRSLVAFGAYKHFPRHVNNSHRKQLDKRRRSSDDDARKGLIM